MTANHECPENAPRSRPTVDVTRRPGRGSDRPCTPRARNEGREIARAACDQRRSSSLRESADSAGPARPDHPAESRCSQPFASSECCPLRPFFGWVFLRERCCNCLCAACARNEGREIARAACDQQRSSSPANQRIPLARRARITRLHPAALTTLGLERVLPSQTFDLPG